jgi:Holliday junction resolvase RusA-like endonuclease
MLKFTIPLPPRTKKNSQQYFINRKTGNPIIYPSKVYKDYENECAWFLKNIIDKPIDYPVNVKAIYYMDTKRRVDLNGLNQSLHDVLVKYGILADDNSLIVAATDGSRARYEKGKARTEVEIEEVGE